MPFGPSNFPERGRTRPVVNASLAAPVLVSLALVAFLAGVGNTGVGVGGVFVTASLYVLTDLPSEVVAGTALATFAATGALGGYSYVRSGELTGGGRTLALTLGVGSGLGVFGGILFNARLPTATVEALFGLAIVVVGISIVYRELRELEPRFDLDPETASGKALFVGVGAGVGFVSGLLGIGGLAVVVPALVLLDVPLLVTIGVGQVVSGLLSFVGAVGFALRAPVDPFLVALIAIPQLVGVVVGWKVAHYTPERPLKLALAGVLVITGMYTYAG